MVYLLWRVVTREAGWQKSQEEPRAANGQVWWTDLSGGGTRDGFASIGGRAFGRCRWRGGDLGGPDYLLPLIGVCIHSSDSYMSHNSTLRLFLMFDL